VSPKAYKAPQFSAPSAVANSSTKLELKSASATKPATGGQFYGYEVGVYDNNSKQYIWGIDGYTSADGKNWTISGVAKGMKIAVREVLYASDGITVLARSAMQAFTLK
jgi:hypothetical protein